MNTLEKIFENRPDEKFLTADGFDDAVIGICDNSSRLIYSKKKCIRILMKDHGMKRHEAIEYFEFNVSGAYVGEETPIWCDDTYE